MFSGIVETTAKVLRTQTGGQTLQVFVARPQSFDDVRPGDSIAINGVCLTLEEFDAGQMQFTLGPETLRVTGWTAAGVMERDVNLERSLRLSDRIHGHLVTGHVDTVGKIVEIARKGDTITMQIAFASEFAPFIWPKGSVAVNGVSLTLNQVESGRFSVGLIPETLRRTNLGALRLGDPVNLEIDNMARGLVNWARQQKDLR